MSPDKNKKQVPCTPVVVYVVSSDTLRCRFLYLAAAGGALAPTDDDKEGLASKLSIRLQDINDLCSQNIAFKLPQATRRC